MAKGKFNIMIRHIRVAISNIVFRFCHTGKIVVSKRPNMSAAKWSLAQKAHRQRFREAVAYAEEAMTIPAIRAIYQQMGKEENMRPFDKAVSHHYHGNDLLSKR